MIKKTNMKKTVGIVLVLFFVVSGFTVSINSEQESFYSDGDTLYVGGNGPGNYSSIQSAIENASDGDIVFVFNGTYYENIIVYKTLNILGESTDNTIIDGQYKDDIDNIFISADDVRITNFTIQCSETTGKGIEINNCNRITISQCNFNNHTSEAIGCIRSSNNWILNCKIENCTIGIRLNGNCNNNIISNCMINTNRTSIGISASNNSVTNCIIKEQLRISWGSNNTILNCHFSNDDIERHAIQMGYTINNILRNNSFDHCGLIFHCNFPQQLYHNIDTTNTINGKPIYYLIQEKDYIINGNKEIGYIGLISCQNITIMNQELHGGIIGDSTQCTIDNCSFIENTHGLAIDLSFNNEIVGCDFSNAYPIRIFKSSNNTINECSMLIGHPYGIGIELDYYSYDNTIKNCQISQFWDGIIITGYSSRNSIKGCDIHCNSGGISFFGDDNRLEKCNIHMNGIGLSVEGDSNCITMNNFYDNTNNAYAYGSNMWSENKNGNYWDDWIGLKNPWLGFFPYHVSITYSQDVVRTFLHSFDWHPASEPYDIPMLNVMNVK